MPKLDGRRYAFDHHAFMVKLGHPTSLTTGPYTVGGRGGGGGNCPPPRENYIYNFYNVIINYSLDIWDFFQYIGLTAPLVEKILRTALCLKTFA